MCSKCLQYLASLLYKGLEGKTVTHDHQMPLIRPSTSCMLCAGAECEFCKQRNQAACRYAMMYSQSMKTPCLPKH